MKSLLFGLLLLPAVNTFSSHLPGCPGSPGMSVKAGGKDHSLFYGSADSVYTINPGDSMFFYASYPSGSCGGVSQVSITRNGEQVFYDGGNGNCCSRFNMPGLEGNYMFTASGDVPVRGFFRVVFADNTGVNEYGNVHIDLFPNPVNDQLTISSAELLNGLTISDAQGRVVKYYSEEFTVKTVDLSFLPAGSYTLSFEDKKGSKIFRKLMK